MREFFDAIASIWNSIPSGVMALILLVVGLVAARLARMIATGCLSLLRVDRIAEKTGFAAFLKKGNVVYSPAQLLGVIAFWLVLIAFLVLIARILDLSLVQSLSARVEELIPSILAAALILAIGSLLVNFLANFVRTIARNAAWSNADLSARIIKYVGNFILVVFALEQIGLGATILSRLMELIVAAVVFGMALAFGLGCKDMARDAAKSLLRNLRERERGSKGGDLEG